MYAVHHDTRATAYHISKEQADGFNKSEVIARAEAFAAGKRRRQLPFVVEGQVQHILDSQGRCSMRPVEVRVHYQGEAIRVACRRALRWMKSGRKAEDAPGHIKLALQIAAQVYADK